MPLRPVKMEITSLENVVPDSNLEVEKEEMNGRKDEFYDASNELPSDKSNIGLRSHLEDNKGC